MYEGEWNFQRGTAGGCGNLNPGFLKTSLFAANFSFYIIKILKINTIKIHSF
jgi:hypothetical protein